MAISRRGFLGAVTAPFVLPLPTLTVEAPKFYDGRKAIPEHWGEECVLPIYLMHGEDVVAASEGQFRVTTHPSGTVFLHCERGVEFKDVRREPSYYKIVLPFWDYPLKAPLSVKPNGGPVTLMWPAGFVAELR